MRKERFREMNTTNNTYTCTCHGEPARFNAQSQQSLGTWSCKLTGKKAKVKRERVGVKGTGERERG